MTDGERSGNKDVCTCANILLAILAIFCPPLVVAMDGCCGDGDFECGLHMCLSIVLTICGWIPGVLHAWWYIFK